MNDNNTFVNPSTFDNNTSNNDLSSVIDNLNKTMNKVIEELIKLNKSADDIKQKVSGVSTEVKQEEIQNNTYNRLELPSIDETIAEPLTIPETNNNYNEEVPSIPEIPSEKLDNTVQLDVIQEPFVEQQVSNIEENSDIVPIDSIIQNNEETPVVDQPTIEDNNMVAPVMPFAPVNNIEPAIEQPVSQDKNDDIISIDSLLQSAPEVQNETPTIENVAAEQPMVEQAQYVEPVAEQVEAQVINEPTIEPVNIEIPNVYPQDNDMNQFVPKQVQPEVQIETPVVETVTTEQPIVEQTQNVEPVAEPISMEPEFKILDIDIKNAKTDGTHRTLIVPEQISVGGGQAPENTNAKTYVLAA